MCLFIHNAFSFDALNLETCHMKLNIEIKDLLSAIDVPAQWVGIREVYEAHTPRMIRDGVPVANARSVSYTHLTLPTTPYV